MTSVISLRSLNVRYGAIIAAHDVSFEVPQGEIVTLIGANGAGKSTLLRAISGLVRPSSGDILHRGTSLVGMPPHRIVRERRICHAPEGRGIFLNLTVAENLDLGAWAAPSRATFAQDTERAFELFPRLKERLTQNAGTLSGGEQQMLAIARALMGHPEILLLDEPSLGLAPLVIKKIFEIIQAINLLGMTILLVEQNALQALKIAHKAVVLESGRVVASAPSQEVLGSSVLREAYLGI
jgi:branched-chain amino acid transport system ATP-binding protein